MWDNRDSLFGALALQVGAITTEELIEAMDRLARGQQASLREALSLDPTQQEAITQIVAIHDTTEPTDSSSRSDETSQRFEVIRNHAEGGLGKVYLAKDSQLGRQVALKEIKDEYVSHESNRSRFDLEAEITARLEHPGIVPVYARGHHEDGRPYYVMKFIRGETMRKAINRLHEQKEATPTRFRGFEEQRLLRQFISVCNAVYYAHQRGVIHRDLKPSNIMLGEYGETLVVDWGLARVVDSECAEFSPEFSDFQTPDRLSRTGKAIGSAGYMSPEQAEGNAPAQATSDIFALGAILYSLLTNRPPFEGSDYDELLAKTRQGRIRDPRSFNRSIPGGLAAIAMKAMSLSPSDRYQSADELSLDVERFLADAVVSAHQESLWERASRLGRRHQAIVRASVLSLCAITMMAVGSTYLIYHSNLNTEKMYKFLSDSFTEHMPEQDKTCEAFVDNVAAAYLEDERLYSTTGQYATKFPAVIGSSYLKLELEEKANRFYLSAIANLKEIGWQDQQMDVLLNNLAGSYYLLNDFDQAADLYETVYGIIRKRHRPQSQEYVNAIYRLAFCRLKQGQALITAGSGDEAQRHLTSAIKLFRQLLTNWKLPPLGNKKLNEEKILEYIESAEKLMKNN